MTEKTISRVHIHVSPGSAETLVKTGGITNHRLIPYTLSDMSAKNYQNRLMCLSYNVQHQCRFLRHSVVSTWMTFAVSAVAELFVNVPAYITRRFARFLYDS